MTEPGRFISLEGGEGAGKSTQARLLAGRLTEAGHKVIVTREPGGTPGAEALRALLVRGDANWAPMAETLIHFAARADHLAQVILPALNAGTWVITDRYVDSTIAYQGAGQSIGTDRVRQIHRLALEDFLPDLTLILDLPVADGLARAGRRLADEASDEDRYERRGQNFHETLRKAFHDIAAQEPQRCRLIDASGSVDSVADSIWGHVHPLVGGS